MKYKHLLVAVDLAESSDLVISRAVSLAKNLDAQLSFIHVDSSHLDNDLLVYDQAEAQLVAAKQQALLSELQAFCEPISYPISNIVVISGEIEEKLIAAVKKMEIDLLISGHHHGFWNRWWSSAHKLVDISAVDLLLIRI